MLVVVGSAAMGSNNIPPDISENHASNKQRAYITAIILQTLQELRQAKQLCDVCDICDS